MICMIVMFILAQAQVFFSTPQAMPLKAKRAVCIIVVFLAWLSFLLQGCSDKETCKGIGVTDRNGCDAKCQEKSKQGLLAKFLVPGWGVSGWDLRACLWCRVAPCHAISCHAMSCLHMPCQAICLRAMPYFCVSCRVMNIPCHAAPRYF